MPGRKALPTALKLLNGNPGKRPLNKAEPKPRSGAPAAPAFLTPAAREEWDRIIPQLVESGVMTQVDGTALASYCMAFSRWLEAEECITEHGVVVAVPQFDKEGNHRGDVLKKNPACTASMACQKEMRALLSLFGMDPSSRSRIKASGKENELSPLAALLKDRSDARAAQRAS